MGSREMHLNVDSITFQPRVLELGIMHRTRIDQNRSVIYYNRALHGQHTLPHRNILRCLRGAG